MAKKNKNKEKQKEAAKAVLKSSTKAKSAPAKAKSAPAKKRAAGKPGKPSNTKALPLADKMAAKSTGKLNKQVTKLEKKIESKPNAQKFADRLTAAKAELSSRGGSGAGASGEEGGYTYKPDPTQQDVVDAAAAIETKKPETGVEADIVSENFESDQDILYNNPNYYNPFGSQEVKFNDDGTLSVEQKLSDSQQKILDQGEAMTIQGGQHANALLAGMGQAFNPEVAQRANPNDLLAERARIENDVYGRLTQNLDRDYQKAVEDKKRELYNRGIPLDMRDARYQAEMGALDENLRAARESARGTATQMGGQEFERQFGIQEQLIANQYSQAQGLHQQQLSDIGTYSSFGTGLQVPQFQAYQGTQYQLQNPVDIHATMADIKQGNKALSLEQQALSQQGGGGGGGGGTPAVPPPPFVNAPPPGL